MTNDEKFIEENGQRFDESVNQRWQTENPFVFWYRPRHQDYLATTFQGEDLGYIKFSDFGPSVRKLACRPDTRFWFEVDGQPSVEDWGTLAETAHAMLRLKREAEAKQVVKRQPKARVQ
jgi:hypothetical protein